MDGGIHGGSRRGKRSGFDWMKQHASDVSISIDSGPSTSAAREISNGLLDLAVGYQYQVSKGVVFEPLFNETLVLVTSWPTGRDWRENYIPIGWDAEFDDEQRRFIGELENNYRLRAPFIDSARALILREPGSAYVVERMASPLIEKGLLRQVEEAPVFQRPVHVIYPSSPSHPDVQAIALQGWREVALMLKDK